MELTAEIKQVLKTINEEGFRPIGFYSLHELGGIGGFIYKTRKESTKHMEQSDCIHCSWSIEEFKSLDLPENEIIYL